MKNAVVSDFGEALVSQNYMQRPQVSVVDVIFLVVGASGDNGVSQIPNFSFCEVFLFLY